LGRRKDSLSTEGFNGAGGKQKRAKRRVRKRHKISKGEKVEKRRKGEIETFFGCDCNHCVGTKDLEGIFGLGR